MAQNTTLGAQALLHVVHLKRKEVVALLLKHGVVVKPSASDLEIAKAVTDLCKISKSFYQAFMQLMADKTVVTSVYSSMDGYSNAGGSFYTPTNFNIGNTTSTTDSFCDKPENKSLGLCSGTSGASSTTSSTKSSGGGSKWLTEGLNVLQTAFNGYLQLDENKTKRELANASVQVAQAGGIPNPNAPAPTTSSSNTTLYVILGLVGISVIGLVVYLATKKK
jgi:LPXTG-motif cell wall-anchored protein